MTAAIALMAAAAVYAQLAHMLAGILAPMPRRAVDQVVQLAAAGAVCFVLAKVAP